MNESAPATLRVPVRGWERLAAGVVAASWLLIVLAAADSGSPWWKLVAKPVSAILTAWQEAVDSESVADFAQPGSYDFANGLRQACDLALALAMPWLIAGGGWIVAGRAGRRMRRIFWLSVVGVGLLGLSRLAAEGRINYILIQNGHPLMLAHYERAVGPLLWTGGWFDRFRSIGSRTGAWDTAVSVGHILLAFAMLWLSRSRKAIDTAEGRTACARVLKRREGNALAAGGAEGAGSRA